MVNQPDFHASWSFWPRIFDPLWEPLVKVLQNCQIPSNFLSLLGQSEVLFGLLSEAIVKVADQDLVQLCVRKYLKLMKLKKISYCLTFDNFDFTRKIQDFFLFGKIRENKVVLYCLIVDHFDFTRKIAKIILKFVKKKPFITVWLLTIIISRKKMQKKIFVCKNSWKQRGFVLLLTTLILREKFVKLQKLYSYFGEEGARNVTFVACNFDGLCCLSCSGSMVCD